jgi:hypothetical protein
MLDMLCFWAVPAPLRRGASSAQHTGSRIWGYFVPVHRGHLEALRPAPGEPCFPVGRLVGIALLERIVREALLVLNAIARYRSNPENRRVFRMITHHTKLSVDGKREPHYDNPFAVLGKAPS